MTDPKQSKPSFTNIFGLLSSAAGQASALREEADRSLYEMGDPAAYKAALIARAQIVQVLPAMLAEYRDVGGEVPPDVDEFAIGWSKLTTECLDSGNMLGIGTLLINQGSRVGEPNELEKLAIQHQPPAETESS
jgi:hypothetical protein